LIPSVDFQKHLYVLVALLSILILSSGSVRAEGNHFLNFGLAGGATIAPNSELESSPPAGDADFDGGYSIKAALGLLLSRKFQLEAEYLYTYNRVDSIINPPTITDLVDSDRARRTT